MFGQDGENTFLCCAFSKISICLSIEHFEIIEHSASEFAKTSLPHVMEWDEITSGRSNEGARSKVLGVLVPQEYNGSGHYQEYVSFWK